MVFFSAQRDYLITSPLAHPINHDTQLGSSSPAAQIAQQIRSNGNGNQVFISIRNTSSCSCCRKIEMKIKQSTLLLRLLFRNYYSLNSMLLFRERDRTKAILYPCFISCCLYVLFSICFFITDTWVFQWCMRPVHCITIILVVGSILAHTRVCGICFP